MTYSPPLLGAFPQDAPATTKHALVERMRDRSEAREARWGASYHRPPIPRADDDWLGAPADFIREPAHDARLFHRDPSAEDERHPAEPRNDPQMTEAERKALKARIRQRIARSQRATDQPTNARNYGHDLPVSHQPKFEEHVDTYNTGIASPKEERPARLAPRQLMAGSSRPMPAPHLGHVAEVVDQADAEIRPDKARVDAEAQTASDEFKERPVGLVLSGPVTWWRAHIWDNGEQRPRNSPRYKIKLWADSRPVPNSRKPEAMAVAHPLDVWRFQAQVIRAAERGAMTADQAQHALEWAKALAQMAREPGWPLFHAGFLSRRDPGEGVVYNYDQICLVGWQADDEDDLGYQPKIHLVLDGAVTNIGIVRPGAPGANAPRWQGYYDPGWKQRLGWSGKKTGP